MIASKQTPTAPVPELATTTVQQQTAASISPITTVSEVCTPQTRPAHPPLTVSSVSVLPSPSPTTHQQFTVHGQFAGPDDHVGPAPNVTVNPFYQPGGGEGIVHHPSKLVPAQNTQDQQIRVLTPSEIMRTLPSLCQENYEPPQTLVRDCYNSVDVSVTQVRTLLECCINKCCFKLGKIFESYMETSNIII